MTGTALAFPTPASLGSLDHYIQAVNRFPLLTAGAGDRARPPPAANATTSTPRASSCCRTCGWSSPCRRNYLGYGLPQADLIQEGNVGLMKAVRRFDPERGVRLVSFALHWIRAEIHEYILRNWRLVKIATTKAQRKLFFNLRSMKASSARAVRRPRPRRIAKDLGVKPEEVVEMETRLSGQDVALDPHAGRRGEHRLADRVPDRQRGRAGADPRARGDRAEPHRGPAAARSRKLDARSRRIIEARWLREDDRRDAAGSGRRVRRVRRADPPDREQGAEVDARRRWRR